MNVLLCFEVSDNLQRVRKELSAKGYMSSWKIIRGSRDEITFHLPSNTLWKKGENMSPTKAKEDLKKIATQLNVKIIRAVAIAIGKFDGITGTRHDSESAVVETAN
ncbi:MAG: hypothetical protein AABZ32_11485 [Bacteroidota bacterium]